MYPGLRRTCHYCGNDAQFPKGRHYNGCPLVGVRDQMTYLQRREQLGDKIRMLPWPHEYPPRKKPTRVLWSQYWDEYEDWGYGEHNRNQHEERHRRSLPRPDRWMEPGPPGVSSSWGWGPRMNVPDLSNWSPPKPEPGGEQPSVGEPKPESPQKPENGSSPAPPAVPKKAGKDRDDWSTLGRQCN